MKYIVVFKTNVEDMEFGWNSYTNMDYLLGTKREISEETYLLLVEYGSFVLYDDEEKGTWNIFKNMLSFYGVKYEKGKTYIGKVKDTEYIPEEYRQKYLGKTFQFKCTCADVTSSSYVFNIVGCDATPWHYTQLDIDREASNINMIDKIFESTKIGFEPPMRASKFQEKSLCSSDDSIFYLDYLKEKDFTKIKFYSKDTIRIKEL